MDPKLLALLYAKLAPTVESQVQDPNVKVVNLEGSDADPAPGYHAWANPPPDVSPSPGPDLSKGSVYAGPNGLGVDLSGIRADMDVGRRPDPRFARLTRALSTVSPAQPRPKKLAPARLE